MASTSTKHEQHGEGPAEGAALVTRLGWMLLGPLAVFLTLLGISKQPQWSVGTRDLLLVVFLLLAVWLRRVDIVRFHGSTARGAQATKRDFWRYTVALIMCTAVAWAAMHSVNL